MERSSHLAIYRAMPSQGVVVERERTEGLAGSNLKTDRYHGGDIKAYN